MKNGLKNRVLRFFETKMLNVNSASRLLGLPQRTINRQVNEDGKVGMELVNALLNTFPEISPRWLLLGEGSMFCNPDVEAALDSSSPFYSELPVSAGRKEVFDPSRETPSGFISVPQWKAEFYFPVSGTSMEPEIYSGDIIGVNRVESINQIDPAKIYMIVTNDSRMIKRCHCDEQNSELLWCVSPNYPSFTINKHDICALFQVVNRIERL